MSWGVVASVGGSIVGNVLGGKGAKKGAKIQASAEDRATEAQERQSTQAQLTQLLMNLPAVNTANIARPEYAGLLGLDTPSVNVNKIVESLVSAGMDEDVASAYSQMVAPGGSAVKASRLMDRVAQTPGYQFAKDEGTQSIMGQNRALGLGQSGTTAKQVGSYVGNTLAFPAYQDLMNRLQGLSGGQAASSLGGNLGNLQTSLGAAQAQGLVGAGNARASGALGKYGAMQGTVDDLSAIAGDYFGRPRGGVGYDASKTGISRQPTAAELFNSPRLNLPLNKYD